EGFYQGLVNSFATMGRMFGPFLGGVLADQYGMQVMLFILTAFMIIPIFTSLVYDRPIKKAENQPESHS
ncbi:MAG: MFS transporter, partial [Sporosarcina sp.]